jgi:hypothetical protein
MVGKRLASAATSADEIAPSAYATRCEWLDGWTDAATDFNSPGNCIKIIYSYAGGFQAAGY